MCGTTKGIQTPHDTTHLLSNIWGLFRLGQRVMIKAKRKSHKKTITLAKRQAIIILILLLRQKKIFNLTERTFKFKS